jgi:predicted nuclease of restriction endonuclease-like (RecB) superfamily
MNLTLFNNDQYKNWLADIKQKIKLAQVKAAVKVNTELINVYWELGKEIIEKQDTANWGDALIDQLSKDLCSEFPDMKGFSRTNLFYIKRWYSFYK